MKDVKPAPPDARSLRQQAEQQLREQPPPAESPLSPSDARTLVQELQVHQIELEMQNDELRRAQKQAQVALDKYTDLFDFAPIGYFQLAQDGMIREVNLAGATLLGLDRNKVVSRRLDVWVARACRQTFATFCETVLASHTRQSCEIQLLCQGRGARDVQLEGLAAPDQVELENTWRLAVLDITPRKQAEAEVRRHADALAATHQALSESEELHRVFFESAAVGMAYVDLEGRFLKVNDRYCELTGYPREELVGKPVLELIHPEDRKKAQQEQGAYLRGELPEYVSEKRYLRKDGSTLWVAINARLIRSADGVPRYSIGVIQDFTHRKRAEETVRQTTEELQRSNRDLEQFASIASHDLQEPLRAVVGYVNLLQMRFPEKLDPKVREYITGAIGGAKRMEQLIADLLAYSRVSARDQALQPADLNAVLADALASLKTSITESRAEVTNDALPTAHVDARQITQVFQNLVGNAIKFCGESTPKIHVGARQEEGRWVISVRDNGIGIAVEHFQRIFKIFQRLHTRKAYPGTGIGLAICQRIVERHGGKIWIESQPGEGSTFFFYLPHAPA
ncbi:MAG: PAS domain S-box protein, partial [Verrucomicrobia bacterium]|nr:PAS domain S-box protein [Verrucomicrobiota bacterium]